jgi:hypothetical protein
MKKFYTSILMLCCVAFTAGAQHSAEIIAAKQQDRAAALAAQQSMAQAMGGSGCAPGFYTVLSENFEAGQPAGWTFTTTGADSWQFGTQTNGLTNPVNGSWATVNDDANDAIGIAVATSPAVNANGGDVSVSFYYDFQSFAGDGDFFVEFWNGSAWIYVDLANQFFPASTFFCTDDCVGTVTLTADAANFGNSDFRFRLTYDDGGTWGWGFGFDDVLVCTQVPPNDLCSGALPISCGQTLQGNTTFATAADRPNPATMSEGIWYVIQGTDEQVTLSTCNAASFDTEIEVYAGSCGALTFVAFNDDFSGCAGFTSQVAFNAFAGVTYYVYVGDWNTSLVNANAGTFSLTATCAPLPPPANDLCTNATVLACGQAVVGTTAGATDTGNNAGAFCGELPGDMGVWYRFVGTGDAMQLNTCGPLTDLNGNAFIAVYDGACGAFNCVANNGTLTPAVGCATQFGQELNFNTVLGTTYYVFVAAYDGGTISFNLQLNCAPPANDDCADAISLSCGDVVTGSTTAATIDGGPDDCEGNASVAADVWYSVVGTGGDIVASLCGSAYDTKIDIRTGSCGGTLLCVAGNDDDCGLQSEVTWASTFGETYLIRVHGWNGAKGAYNLAVTCAELPCDATAGTLVADESQVCLTGGSASISASVTSLPNVPTGYAVGYVLTTGAGLVIVDVAATPDFVVTSSGDYTIHTIVFDPADQGTLLSASTGFEVNGLLIQGGGTICGALDVAGAAIEVGSCDCNGDFGGTAVLDNCDVCVGGNTGLTACVADCNGDFGGTAVLDNCDVCVGGNTGLTACVADCNGDFGGTAFIDDCDDCVGGNTGLIACVPIGVEESLTNSLSVYPNPNNGQFIVGLSGAEGLGTLNIMDMMGRMVYTVGVNFNGSFRQAIDLNVAKGTYVLQVITENGVATRKVELH